jgi:hypothetical protein
MVRLLSTHAAFRYLPLYSLAPGYWRANPVDPDAGLWRVQVSCGPGMH